MLPIMLQLYNLREELAADFEETLQKIAGLGYRYVELAGLYGKTPAAFKAALLKAGLTAISAHVPYRDMLVDPEKVIGQYIELGCKYIVVPYLNEEDRCTSPNYEGVKKEIAKLGEITKKLGAVLLYHNHDFEFQQYRGKYALDDLYDSIPADILQTEIDTCWANIGGVNPAEYILKYRGRSPVVHLKDFYLPEGITAENMYELIGIAKQAAAPEKGGFEFRAVGYGKQDIPAILKASEEAGASWVVVEQDRPTPGKTPLECAKDSIEYLKGLA
ncbi:MAG: sugar phosphate isomerase/epimerase [Spirochaetaceae bacterium]|jgi:sugar phosphate isomerase/epimerase|nr:sugar phosphate isomerase/epimerase [Spirochaetaceae bacterium]